MNKKFLIIGAILVLMAMVFTSCDPTVTGTKYNKTITLDGTNLNKKGEALTEGDDGYLAKNYRRNFKKFSSEENTGWITTTIEVDPEKTILGLDASGNEIKTINNSKASVAKASNFGLIFDYHTDKDETTNDEFVDFCLLGVQPATGRFYVERYEGINYTQLKKSEKDDEAPLDTDAGSLGNYVAIETLGGTFTSNVSPLDDWHAIPAGALEVNYVKTLKGENKLDEAGNPIVKNYSITISIKQGTVGDNNGVAGRYDIYIGDTKVGTYQGITKYEKTGDYKDFCVGGIGCYATCPKGTKICANYNTTRNTSLTGVDKNVGPKFSEYGAEPVLY